MDQAAPLSCAEPGVGKGSAWRAGLAVFAAAILFALLTSHVWEDHYITYRVSVNLAEGNGLVFTPGERVHTFTSPLNTLVPALYRYALGEGSDTAVLWLYRLTCAGLLGGACVLLHRLLSAFRFGTLTLAAALVMACLESKVVDYTINGQEVAFMMFFLAVALTALLRKVKRPGLLLGLAWTGAMYNRPDAFIYCIALAAGFFLFAPSLEVKRTRLEILRLYAVAAAWVFALYLPWFLWAWQYYGSPVPHTVTAKGLDIPHGLSFLRWHAKRVLGGPGAGFEAVGMPSYYALGAWNDWLSMAMNLLGTAASLYWLCPWARPAARALSFASFASLYYLNYFPLLAYPWYYPNAWFFTALAAGFLLDDLRRLSVWSGERIESESAKRWMNRFERGIPTLLIALTLAVTAMVGLQMRQQQRIIEDGVRTKVGLWLKEHATSPRDTVFLECLGYIGYFSGLKTYDWPGLSSPEVVAVRRKMSDKWDWGALILELRPDWIVARPREERWINEKHPEVLTRLYAPAQVFDVTEAVYAAAWIPGRNYLCGDMKFTVYKRVDAGK